MGKVKSKIGNKFTKEGKNQKIEQFRNFHTS